MLQQIKTWVTQYIRSVMESTIRVAVVDSTSPKNSTVRVRVADGDDLITYDLRVLVHKTSRDKSYWMPDIGDQVLCLFLPFGLEQGFVLGSFYSSADQPPVQSQDKRYVVFQDGTWLEYDRAQHLLTGNIQGAVDIYAAKAIKIESGDSIQLTAPRIDLN